MKVAVTGSNGMVGKALVRELKAKKYEVIECPKNKCNVLNPDQVKQAIKGAEIVIHCVAILEEGAKELYEVNVKGTENVLEACATNQVQQLIYLSSIGVYGSAKGIKTEESPLAPGTEYEKSKLDAEKKVLSYQEIFHVTVLRPALIVGENKYWREITRTVKKNFPLIGSGQNNWQMLCLSDMVDAIIFCINNEDTLGETFIVAEKNTPKLIDAVNIIRKTLDMKGPTKKIPLLLGKIITILNLVLNFNPILKPAYLERMQRDRFYSTKKLEKIGWTAKKNSLDCIEELVKKFNAKEKSN
ncbi:MAG: hypothetical protein COV47_03260 [Candidatus Diapherotrites archaeon CG11_big_fil_rev_8_21_14_0_20_37_9]|nr:MAG: hypothetical protein COV47_03260 [Candidatus Diapherotrites archaeon CG11_big_fil_rev_8_21_14_0_20_37_9]